MSDALPDLARPVPDVPGEAYFAVDRNDEIVVLPQSLAMETNPGGQNQALLTLLRGVGDATGTGGRFEVGLVLATNSSALGEALAHHHVPGQLRVADPVRSDVSLSSRLGPIGADVALGPLPADFALFGSARLSLDLAPPAASVMAQMLETGTAPLQANAHLFFSAIAPRIPFAVTVDPHDLSDRLARELGTQAQVGDGLDRELALLVDCPQPDALADLLSDRLIDEHGRLRDPAVVPSGQVRIDLSLPRIVAIDRTLQLDHIGARVERIDLPPLPDGHGRISVGSNLPEPIQGLLALFADLRVPPVPPFAPASGDCKRVAGSTRTTGSGRAGPVARRGVLREKSACGHFLQDAQAGGVEMAGAWRPLTGPNMFCSVPTTSRPR